MCLAQGPQRSDAGEARGSSVLNSSALQLRSLSDARVGLGALGYPGGQYYFFQHGHVAYQMDGDNE